MTNFLYDLYLFFTLQINLFSLLIDQIDYYKTV